MATYFVYQNQTYSEERAGKYIWSPKLNQNGHRNAGYELMREVHQGDFIIHSSGRKIVSVSVAQTDCYSCDQPKDLGGEDLWNLDGYRVDLEYFDLTNPYDIGQDENWLISNYDPASPFTVKGKGKQRYLCDIPPEQTLHLLSKALKKEPHPTVAVILDSVIAAAKKATKK